MRNLHAVFSPLGTFLPQNMALAGRGHNECAMFVCGVGWGLGGEVMFGAAINIMKGQCTPREPSGPDFERPFLSFDAPSDRRRSRLCHREKCGPAIRWLLQPGGYTSLAHYILLHIPMPPRNTDHRTRRFPPNTDLCISSAITNHGQIPVHHSKS